jgi:hypothetical protein
MEVRGGKEAPSCQQAEKLEPAWWVGEWDGVSVMPPCDLLKEQGQTHGLPFG